MADTCYDQRMASTDSLKWPEGWHELGKKEAALVAAQLCAEIGSTHILCGLQVELIARRRDQDDVLALLDDGRVAEIHLTWRKSTESEPQWPKAKLYQDLDAWLRSQGLLAAVESRVQP